MQPDLLSPDKEEHQPETLASPHAPQAETSITSQSSQPEPTPVEKSTTVSSPGSARKKSTLPVIALGVCAFLLLVATAWVGYWAYTLSTELTSTQQQFAALQGEHDKLQSEYTALKNENATLNADLTQTRADLEKANADLATAQADLKKSQDQNKTLNARLEKAGKLADILNSFFNLDQLSSFMELPPKIRATHDAKLIALWDGFTSAPSEDKFGEVLKYLVPAIADALK